MEALSVIAPFVLVLRGSTLAAVVSISAPGAHPHIASPAQKISRAIAQVEIVVATTIRRLELEPDLNGDVRIGEYRIQLRRRAHMSSNISRPFAELVLDYP